jgi:prepilin-type N-terminal cleavage/methylation domain-containing protein
MKRNHRAFTIVELIVVIVIIAILASITAAVYKGTQSRARDAKRLTDFNSIEKGLGIYKARNGVFPASAPNPGSATWEISSDPNFLASLASVMQGPTMRDPTNTGTYTYYYHTFAAGTYGCPAAAGPFYVLWFRGMETQSSEVIDTGKCPGQTLFTPTGQAGVSYQILPSYKIKFGF